MATEIHLSIDDGPERILEMGRTLTDEEKARVKAAVCGFVRLLQVWMDDDRMTHPLSPGPGLSRGD